MIDKDFILPQDIPNPAKFSEAELQDLHRKNRICFIEQQRERILSTIKKISNEVVQLKLIQHSLYNLEAFLYRYLELLEGSLEPGEDEVWLPLMTMLLDTLKGISHEFKGEFQEVAEENVIQSFLGTVKELGFERPSIVKSERGVTDVR